MTGAFLQQGRLFSNLSKRVGLLIKLHKESEHFTLVKKEGLKLIREGVYDDKK